MNNIGTQMKLAILGLYFAFDVAVDPSKHSAGFCNQGLHELVIDAATGEFVRQTDITPDGDIMTIKQRLPSGRFDRESFYRAADGSWEVIPNY